MKIDVPYNYLLDIITDIENSISNLSKNNFGKNKYAIDANIRRIIIINDVIENISQHLKDKHSEIDCGKLKTIKISLENK